MFVFSASITYIILLSVFTFKSKFLTIKSLSKTKLITLLLVKILAGFIYVFVSKNYISGGDIFNYYNDSLIIYDEILQGNFFNYLQLTFGRNNVSITDNISLTIDKMGFWYDTPSYFMVRLNALFNLLSFGQSIYINSIFFSFLSFIASLTLAQLFQKLFKYHSNWITYVIFLSPSLLFWTSGMHKESVSVFLVSCFLFSFFQIMHQKKYKYIIQLLICAFILTKTRFFILGLFIPPLIAYSIWITKPKIRPIYIFSIVAILVLISTYLVPQLFHTANLVDAIIYKKELYESLGTGNTAISLGEYSKSYWGIFQKIPQALFNSIVRPHFLDIHSFFLLSASIESFILSVLLVSSLFYIKNLNTKKRAIVLLVLFFSLSYLTLTGLIVPNLGAILRYRSVALFILIPTIAYLLSTKNEVL